MWENRTPELWAQGEGKGNFGSLPKGAWCPFVLSPKGQCGWDASSPGHRRSCCWMGWVRLNCSLCSGWGCRAGDASPLGNHVPGLGHALRQAPSRPPLGFFRGGGKGLTTQETLDPLSVSIILIAFSGSMVGTGQMYVESITLLFRTNSFAFGKAQDLVSGWVIEPDNGRGWGKVPGLCLS